MDKKPYQRLLGHGFCPHARGNPNLVEAWGKAIATIAISTDPDAPVVFAPDMMLRLRVCPLCLGKVHHLLLSLAGEA